MSSAAGILPNRRTTTLTGGQQVLNVTPSTSSTTSQKSDSPPPPRKAPASRNILVPLTATNCRGLNELLSHRVFWSLDQNMSQTIRPTQTTVFSGRRGVQPIPAPRRAIVYDQCYQNDLVNHSRIMGTIPEETSTTTTNHNQNVVQSSSAQSIATTTRKGAAGQGHLSDLDIVSIDRVRSEPKGVPSNLWKILYCLCTSSLSPCALLPTLQCSYNTYVRTYTTTSEGRSMSRFGSDVNVDTGAGANCPSGSPATFGTGTPLRAFNASAVPHHSHRAPQQVCSAAAADDNSGCGCRRFW